MSGGERKKNELLNMAFDLFNNAKNISFEKHGKYISIKYYLNDD